ncbi:hypothetical protein QJS10_CPB04g01557 [Acorus calamus]|uniref:Exopolyphosphatase n=1 Tax=Acorus calamus TaxID=4465 RepID=A0AAV9EWW8_ACOCL|nr:hypothetical protein QJS10_CPB04g01557 [Acorus calamus]
MQKKKLVVETRRPEPPAVPDITDLMNDWFFGSANADRRTYKEVEEVREAKKDDDDGGDSESEGWDNRKSRTSRMTEEWLEEAKRMVAMSPTRQDSPRFKGGLPRFASAQSGGLDRRDPLSRSARRHKSTEGFSGEILSKTTNHTRNKSDSSSAFHLLSDDPPSLPPRQPTTTTSLHRKSRFHLNPPPPHHDPLPFPPPSDPLPVPPRRSFRSTQQQQQLLSPPKNLVQSAHRRSVSSSTCSLDKLFRPPDFVGERGQPRVQRVVEEDVARLNVFLKEQKEKVDGISNGEVFSKAKIILSGSSTSSTSSMVAAICYAWMLENMEDKKDDSFGVVVPVMNVKRARMWKHRKAAWLFHCVGIDASALLFSDEVDLEGLIMARQLSILVVGQDVLKTNNKVGSQCTILTDHYCEDAYDLLQTPNIKKLLLAGILLDTQNLSNSARLATNRDVEAVQLLSVGSALNLRQELYDELMQEHKENSFLEALRRNYGKPPNETKV